MFTRDDLVEESLKHIRRFERHARAVHAEDDRRRRRGQTADGVVHRPSHWALDAGFDPFIVRSRATPITRAVRAAIGAGDYRPRTPVAHPIMKASREPRPVSVFQLADALVSRQLFNALQRKNEALFGAYSYAYRTSLTHHDAAQLLAASLKKNPRLFVSEFDFSKFFDSIEHRQLLESLETEGFLVTPSELRTIGAFMASQAVAEDAYDASSPATRTRGIPQGTAISLFLANVAARTIDENLNKLGVRFARYADDTIIWSNDYGALTAATDALIASGASIGASVNWGKSKGIRLLTVAPEKAEIEATASVDFVGYEISHLHTSLKEATVDRAKARISRILFSNLIQPLKTDEFDPARVNPNFDRDYSVALMQIRRYLYGNLSEQQVRELQRGSVRRLRYPGLMAYYPLVDDIGQLQSLDGWLLATIRGALRQRAKMLAARGITTLPSPYGMDSKELLVAESTTSKGTRVDLSIPSFVRISTLIHRAARTLGANEVARGRGDIQYQYNRDANAP